MASFLRTLDALNRLQEAAPRGPGFLDSHPSTPERVAAAASRGVTLSRPGAASRNGASARRRYLDRVEGLLVGENPAEGVIREGLLLHPDLGFALRLPAGWRVRNRHDALGAASPRGDALVLLELQGRGEDPERAARAFARAGGIVFLEAGAERGARLPTYRALTARTTEQGRLAVELIWIAWGGAIYRITGLTPSASYLGHRTQFRAVARSFRPLTDTERAGIRSQRLRLVTAREGETLRDLSARSGNAWNLLETAARNEMRSDTRLVKGTLVKIARAEPYPGRRPAPDGGPER